MRRPIGANEAAETELIKFPSNKNVIGTLGWSGNVLHAGSYKFSVFDRFQDSTIRMQWRLPAEEANETPREPIRSMFVSLERRIFCFKRPWNARHSSECRCFPLSLSLSLSLSLPTFPWEQPFPAEIRSFSLSWLTANDYLIDSIAVIRLSSEIFETWLFTVRQLRHFATSATLKSREFPTFLLIYSRTATIIVFLLLSFGPSNAIIWIISSFLEIYYSKETRSNSMNVTILSWTSEETYVNYRSWRNLV